MTQSQNFYQSYSQGLQAEQRFTNFLTRSKKQFVDVLKQSHYMNLGIDFLVKNGKTQETYEVKNNLPQSLDHLIFETHSNYNTKLAPLKAGWLHTCMADYIVFFSKHSTDVVKLDFNGFKMWYQNNSNYKIQMNSFKTEYRYHWGLEYWQSAYVRIPLSDLPQNIFKKFKIK